MIVPPAVYIRDTGTARGRGVFAARAFKQGDVVEACPVVTFVPLPGRQLPPDIRKIVFAWGRLLGLDSPRPAIALGYGSMYNHSNPAGLRCQADAANSILRFIALRDIDADEELTINYNAINAGASSSDQWFDDNGVTLIADS